MSAKPSAEVEPTFLSAEVVPRDMMNAIPFRPFDSHKAVRIYRHNLPHWRQAGCTYFVTFRLGDSVPRHVTEGWQQDRLAWLRARGIACDGVGSFLEVLEALPSQIQHEDKVWIGIRLDACLDKGMGSCMLRHEGCAKIVADSLHFFHGRRLGCGDFVVMPNHVHWLVTPYAGFQIERLLQTIKGFSARKINRLRGNSGRLWQKRSYDRIVRGSEELRHCREYIAANPGKAHLASTACLSYRVEWDVLG